MTNKKFRDDLAKEMRDKYNERNEKLEQAEKSSFPSGLKEQMKKEIMDNFTKEMDEMKSRPWYEEAKKTHLEEIKAKIKLAKSKKEYEDSLKAYKDAQIAHRWEVEQKITEDSENKEKSEIPQDLKDFRKAWKEIVKNLSHDFRDNMDDILKKIDEIPVKVEIDNDGSRLIEFELWWKTWKILDPKLEKYSEGFRPDWENWYIDSINRTYDYNYVKLKWIRWDVDERENEKLRDYVKKKKNEWLDMATMGQIKEILSALWEKADLDSENDQIAMLGYLTWMDWCYWLKDTSWSSRSELGCDDFNLRGFAYYPRDNDNASLCMIACQ